MNLVKYQSELEYMIETRNFDQRSKLENLATLSPEHQKVWEDFLIIEHTLPAWKQTLPEIDLVEAVMSQLAGPPNHSLESTIPSEVPFTTDRTSHTSTRWLYGSLLTAAALLIAISLKFSGDQPAMVPPNTIATNTNIISDPQIPPIKTKTPNQSFNQLLRNAGAASWGLAQSTAGTMTEAVSLVPVTRPTPETTGVVPAESHWVDDINHEMQPLKDQISHAWNFILHSVPEESTRI
ncbi:hypothetical protein Pan241w_12920 [Gimesia alba]|uniref:Uncharacterized protein n=1 Tax=Gimesia alba TaxID=2527973 RepID=A0A517RBI1_9PLAN|nr:hypothetical protein [Gimesia alba]QDT41232.1 hypothetical protein Pan241w_12920 [Gimesia alba]